MLFRSTTTQVVHNRHRPAKLNRLFSDMTTNKSSPARDQKSHVNACPVVVSVRVTVPGSTCKLHLPQLQTMYLELIGSCVVNRSVGNGSREFKSAGIADVRVVWALCEFCAMCSFLYVLGFWGLQGGCLAWGDCAGGLLICRPARSWAGGIGLPQHWNRGSSDCQKGLQRREFGPPVENACGLNLDRRSSVLRMSD